MTTKSYEYNNFYVSIITVRSNKNHMHWFKQRCQYMYLNQFICYCLITCRHCVGFDSNRLSWHVFIDICLHHITTNGCIARCPWYRYQLFSTGIPLTGARDRLTWPIPGVSHRTVTVIVTGRASNTISSLSYKL